MNKVPPAKGGAPGVKAPQPPVPPAQPAQRQRTKGDVLAAETAYCRLPSTPPIIGLCSSPIVPKGGPAGTTPISRPPLEGKRFYGQVEGLPVVFLPKGYLVVAQGMNGQLYALELNPKYHGTYGRFVAVEIEAYAGRRSQYDAIGRRLHISPQDAERPDDGPTQQKGPDISLPPKEKEERSLDITIRTGPEKAIESLLDEGRFAKFVDRWSLKRNGTKITVSIRLSRGLEDRTRESLERIVTSRLEAYYRQTEPGRVREFVVSFNYSRKGG